MKIHGSKLYLVYTSSVMNMKSTLLGIIVLNVIVIFIGVFLMLRNLVGTQAFNFGLAFSILGLSIILITREINGK